MAQTRLSSATAAIEPLLDAVLRLGLPIVGVISEQQEAIGVAVHHKLPTVPQPIGQDHEVTDVAHPIGDAARHGKQALTKKSRGMRERARQAAAPPSPAAPRGADDGLAVRTGMRDEGADPLEPPGVTLAQKWPLLGASGERVMGAHPSAVLTKLSRMLAVLPLFPPAFAPLVIRFRWIHHLAHLLTAETRRAQAPSRLLTGVHPLHQSCSHDGLLRVVAYVEQITIALTPHLVEDLKPLWLPRTKNDLDLFMGRLKKSRRHITDRQNPHALILREGSVMAILFGLPETTHGVNTFPRVNPDAFHHTLNRVRQPANRRTCWHARHDFAAYLASLEPHCVSHE